MYQNTGQAEQSAQNGWVQHNDPKGFTLTHPTGWSVETTADGRILARSPYPSLFVLIHPFTQTGAGGAEAWVHQATTTYADLLPGATLQNAQRRPGEQILGDLTFRVGIAGVPAKANFLCRSEGPTGMFYMIAAPLGDFASWRPALVYVLQSLRFTAPAAPPPTRGEATLRAEEIAWERWTDPREQSFDIEIPRGWKASGGLFRYAVTDVRGDIRLQSPDGGVYIFAGDQNIPTFCLPSDIGMSLGFGEGMPYSPGYGVNMIISRYKPGAMFAQEYVQGTLARQFGGVQIQQIQERPDLAQQAYQENHQAAMSYGMQQQYHYGEVVFASSVGGRMKRGYCLVGTTMTGSYQAGLWNVTALHGYFVDPDKEQLARTVLLRMIASSRPNPQWVAQQQQATGQTSALVAQNSRWMAEKQQQIWQTMQETTDIINQSYWDRQASQDNRNRQFGNYLMDQTDVRDTSTGETWKVASGHNYYWRRSSTDTIVGTDTYDRPDTDFTPLNEF